MNVITDNAFAINAGKNKGITRNMKFEILNPLFEAKNANSRVLHDSKGTVKITEVYEKFSIAEGYEIEMKDSSFFRWFHLK